MIMKDIVEYLSKKNLIFKSLKEIQPKEIGSRKRVSLYIGVDLKKYYALVMIIEKKSRVLRKDVGELIELHTRLEKYIDSKINKKYIIIKAPLCSHAKAMLDEDGWRVWNEL